jgi:hypothetical protein
MGALPPFPKRLHYKVYYKRPEAIKTIFTLFLTEPDASYAMRKVSEHTKVTISILSFWREKFAQTPISSLPRNIFLRMQRYFRLKWKRR